MQQLNCLVCTVCRCTLCTGTLSCCHSHCHCFAVLLKHIRVTINATRLAASASSAKPRSSICDSLSSPSRWRTAQWIPVLRQQRTPSAMRRTLADKAAGVQERCHANSHCSAHRRDHSASWLATLQWTLFRLRRRWSRQHVLKAVSFTRHGIQHDWKYTICRVHVSPGSAETLVRRGGTTSHHLIAYSQQHLPKITKIGWCALKL